MHVPPSATIRVFLFGQARVNPAEECAGMHWLSVEAGGHGLDEWLRCMMHACAVH